MNNITLALNPGDRVGIIGHNGAGKTTLLRVLSGTYVPTSGNAEVVGEVSALTDIAMGMNMEASGHENIVMRAILLGLTYKQARALAPRWKNFQSWEDILICQYEPIRQA